MDRHYKTNVVIIHGSLDQAISNIIENAPTKINVAAVQCSIKCLFSLFIFTHIFTFSSEFSVVIILLAKVSPIPSMACNSY